MAVAWDVYRKDSDRSTTQCDLNCYRLEVRVYLDQLVVESFLDIDRNSSTRKLVRISSHWLKIAVIIGTSIMTQRWGMLQFGFLQAYNIWLMLMNQDIKVPSVTSQTPNVPLQYSSHYDLFGLVEIFLFFRSPAGFVIGDVTRALFAPFLFSSTFFFGVGSWFGTYEGAFVGLLVPSIWDGDTLAYGPDALPSPVCEATLALETGHLWASPTEFRLWASPTDVLCVLPTEVVFWTPSTEVSGHLAPRVSLKCEVHGGLPHQKVCGTVPQRSPGNEFFSLVLGFGLWGLRSSLWVHWLYSEAVFSCHWAESYAPAGQLVQQLQHWPMSFLGQMCLCVVPQLFF